MVKVIIMTDGKVIEKEGEFFFGFTAKEENDGTSIDSAIIGNMDLNHIPRILSDVSVEANMRLHEGDVLNRADALIELDQHVSKAVKEKIVSDSAAMRSLRC